ncbi:MAG TPA: hypothetical protein VGC66_08170 [Pyrinomonadaceae bacterium]|jgi:hypothetical protein
MLETVSQPRSTIRYEAQIRARVLEQDKGTNPLTSQKWSTTVTTRIHKDWGQPFRGKLSVPGSRIIFPEQDFTFYRVGYHFVIKNHPVNQWPNIEIELVASDEHAPLQVARFDVRPSENTTDAEILYTRLVFSMVSSGKLFLPLGDEIINFGISKFSPLEETNFLHRSQLFRKLKFIEKVFNCTFHLPIDISDSDVRQIETVFRGITEGEFTLRGDNITFFDYTPTTPDELCRPPFTGVGSFTRNVGDQVLILDRLLPVGSVSIRLDHAVVANPSLVESLQAGGTLPQIRVAILDNQIHHRFEKYVTRRSQLRLRKLEKFKKELSKTEPEELVDLLDYSLQSDVSAEEARKTVIGWLDYNQFPDRFWPQQPVLEEVRWRVPLSITAPQGQGAWIQDLFVDLKVGSVSSPIAIEELKALGKSIAAEMFRAV